MFWALWAAKHDVPRLAVTLDWIASYGVDYIRALSMVGSQPYWADRVIDPSWDDYDTRLMLVLDACVDRGLRVQLVLFADAQVMMPSQDDRRAWVQHLAPLLNTKRHAIQFVEIANESNLNGVNDADLAELTQLWADASDILVAPSSPDGSDNPEAALDRLFEHHAGAASSDLLTPHFSRRVDTIDGPYRCIRQPWEVQFYTGMLRTFVNNEPVGPGSSGYSEPDPERLASQMLTTYVSKGAAYCLHANAGVRGDRPYWEGVSVAVMEALQSVRTGLPTAIANGTPHNHHWAGHPYETDDQIWPDTHEDGVVRSYASELHGEYWVSVIGLRGTYRIKAKFPMQVDVVSLTSGATLESVTLDAGEAHTFRPDAGRDIGSYLHHVLRV